MEPRRAREFTAERDSVRSRIQALLRMGTEHGRSDCRAPRCARGLLLLLPEAGTGDGGVRASNDRATGGRGHRKERRRENTMEARERKPFSRWIKG